MYKKVPGNNEFKISLSGKIVNNDDTECTLEIVNGKVNIEMWGVTRQLDTEWLGLIAHFELDQLHEKFRDKIFNIKFEDKEAKNFSTLSWKVMIIYPSIYFKSTGIDLKIYEFRIIPGFVRYGINKYGDIFDTQTLGLVYIPNRSKSISYLTTEMYDPDTNSNRSTLVHRLVALAWVPNRDYVAKPIVNHKDGNKKNCYYKNLEWCTYKHNSLHAARTGLREDNIRCKIRNAYTKEITEFMTIREACEFMKIDVTTKLFNMKFKTKHKLVAGKFEVKDITDDTPWFYENHELGTKSGRYNITVTYPDGKEELHPNLKTFKKTFGIWNVSNINDHIDRFKSLYPGHQIDIKDNYVLGPIQAYNVITGEIFEADGIRQMAKIINVNFSFIHNTIKRGETRVCQGYAFRYKTDTPWNTNFTTYESSAKCISATHQETNKVIIFKSLREAAKHFNTDRSRIKLLIRNKTPYRFWIFKEIEN